MKAFLLTNKKLLFIAISVSIVALVTYLFAGILFLKLGSISYRNKDNTKAEIYYRYAHKFLFLGAKAEDRLNTLKNELSSDLDSSYGVPNIVTVPTDSIKVLNSSVSKGAIENFSNEMGPQITTDAIYSVLFSKTHWNMVYRLLR